MVKIRYSDEFVCPTCGSHTALVCHTDGTHQAHCMICDVYYDVEIAPITNYDLIRAKSMEEMADMFDLLTRTKPESKNDKKLWLDWLKKEVSTNG